MNTRVASFAMWAAAFAVAMPFVAPTPARAVDGKTIVIGATGPQTGPDSPAYVLDQGTEAYFNYINDRGGIRGYKIKYVILNDSYVPAQTVAAVKRLAELEHVDAIVQTTGSPGSVAAAPLANEYKIPLIAASASSKLVEPVTPFVFAAPPSYASEGAFFAKYAVNTLKSKKIAIFYQNDALGLAGSGGAREALKALGITPVLEVPFVVSDTNYAPYAQKLQASGATTVLMWGVQSPSAQILKAADSIGFKPQWFITNPAGDPVTLNLAGAAAEGVYFGAWLPLATSNDAKVVTYRDALKKYFPNITPGSLSQWGWIDGQIIVAAIDRVLRAKQIPDAGHIAAELAKLDTNETLIPINFNDTKHSGASAFTLVRVENKAFVTVK